MDLAINLQTSCLPNARLPSQSPKGLALSLKDNANIGEVFIDRVLWLDTYLGKPLSKPLITSKQIEQVKQDANHERNLNHVYHQYTNADILGDLTFQKASIIISTWWK